MSRNLMPIVYGVLAVLAVALGLFIANLFGNPAVAPTGPTNGVASAPAPTGEATAPPAGGASAAPTAAPAATTAAPAATAAPTEPVPPTLVVGAEPTDAPAPTAAPVDPTAVPATPEPTAAPTAAPPAEAAFIEYTVQRGDSLKSIAQRYNTTVTALLNANELRNPDSLTVGTVIKVPRT